MACINTNDRYVRDYCSEHPEAADVLGRLTELRDGRLRRLYGLPEGEDVSALLGEAEPGGRLAGVKAVQLDLLRELNRACSERGLRLFLFYGSLLGAVRSGGMLDGDDDIDVALLREDYDRLAELAPSFKAPYFLQNNYNDGCFFGGYMKFRNAGTTAVHPQNWYVDCCEGIFIDVFPLDRCFGSAVLERRKLRRIRTLQRLLYAGSYGFFARFLGMPLLIWKFYKYRGKLTPRAKLLAELDDAFRSHDGKGEELAVYARYGTPEYMPREAFGGAVPVSYEGMELSAPAGWDAVLRESYGEGYLRPADRREGLHAFYRTDVPYGAYKERFSRLFTSVPDRSRKLVAVGDAELLGEYRKRFPGTAYKPDAFLVCGDEGKPGELSRLREYDPASTFVVIAAFDFLTAEDAVRALGFRDYAIYVYDRSWLFLPDLKASRKKYLEEMQNRKNRR